MSTKAFDFFIMDVKYLNMYLLYCKRAIELCLIATFTKHSDLHKVLTAGFGYSWDSFLKLQPEITKVMQSQHWEDKDYLDLTNGVSIWLWKDKVVVKVYGFNYQLAQLLKQPRYVKDFSYWNNTDKPDEVSNKEWNVRRKFFDKTIELLPRLNYTPYDFLSRDAFKALFELERIYLEYKKGVKK